jgi:phosphoserine phosphatase RsbU/P
VAAAGRTWNKPPRGPYIDGTDTPPDRSLFQTLMGDVRSVWADFREGRLERTFKRTFTDLKEFYLDANSRDRLQGERRFRRSVFLAVWLLKSLFLKLTPARRVLLAFSVLFMTQAIDIGWRSAATQHISVRFPFLGIAILLIVLMLELKDKLLAREELEAGRAVQQALMPDASPAIPGWDVWLFTRSANDVGGDLVDHVPLGGPRHGLVLGDVAGKGLPAALLMAKLQSTLRALAADEPSLAALGGKMNRILCRDGLPNRFATLVYLDLADRSGAVRLLNAGHLPPLILRATAVEEFPGGSAALGMMPEAGYVEQRVDLANGEALIVFSDGLTEAMNGEEEFFGDERLRAQLPGAAGLAAEVIGRRVVAAVDSFVGDARPHDDLSLVVLRRTA